MIFVYIVLILIPFLIIWLGFYFWMKKKKWTFLLGFLIAIFIYISVPFILGNFGKVYYPVKNFVKCAMRPGPMPNNFNANNDGDAWNNLQECAYGFDWNDFDTDNNGVGDGYIAPKDFSGDCFGVCAFK